MGAAHLSVPVRLKCKPPKRKYAQIKRTGEVVNILFSSITLSLAHKRCSVDCYLPLFSVVEEAKQRDPLREDHVADSSLSFAKKAETPLPESILSSAHPL